MTTAGTAAQGATSLKQLGLGTYGTTYLVVLEIDFNTVRQQRYGHGLFESGGQSGYARSDPPPGRMAPSMSEPFPEWV